MSQQFDHRRRRRGLTLVTVSREERMRESQLNGYGLLGPAGALSLCRNDYGLEGRSSPDSLMMPQMIRPSAMVARIKVPVSSFVS